MTSKFAFSFLGADVDEDITNQGELTATGDALIFSKGTPLSLSATTDNFNGTSGNLSANTNPSVKLVAATKNKSAESAYAIGFKISNNTYQYTTSDKKAELILTVKDESDRELTSAEGLNYVTVNGVSGFDITELTGIFNLEENHPISTTSTTDGTTHTWTFTLTFVNFETDQSLNETATLSIEAILQKEKIATPTLSNYIKSLKETDTSIVYHDSSLENGANDNSYRYTGANPNNYICFGSDAEICPSGNLYRIIGVFGDQTKLVHATYATTAEIGTSAQSTAANDFYWSGSPKSQDAIWANSTLNTESLNGTFLNNLGTAWSDKIATTTWNVGGMASEKIESPNTVKDTYDYEVGANKNDTTYEAKIGLPYVNEYGYAADPSYWATDLYDYEPTVGKDWMRLESDVYWTISQVSDRSGVAFVVSGGGYLDCDAVLGVNRVRPSFNLVSSVKLSGGAGTESNPYRIEL